MPNGEPPKPTRLAPQPLPPWPAAADAQPPPPAPVARAGAVRVHHRPLHHRRRTQSKRPSTSPPW